MDEQQKKERVLYQYHKMQELKDRQYADGDEGGKTPGVPVPYLSITLQDEADKIYFANRKNSKLFLEDYQAENDMPEWIPNAEQFSLAKVSIGFEFMKGFKKLQRLKQYKESFIAGSSYEFSFYEKRRAKKNLDECNFKAPLVGILGY